jgi:hypothetical protein
MKKLLLILICAPLLLLYNSCSKGGDVPTPNNTPTLQSIIVDQIWELKTEEYRFILNKNGYMYEKSAVCAEFDLKGSWTLEDNDLIITYQQGSLEISEISQITSFSENEIKFNIFTDSTTIIEEVYVGVEAVIRGCTDADSSTNYNPNAVCDDNSCIPCIYGCMEIVAVNYDSLATCEDGSCIGVVYGCTDITALNYDPLATVDDGSCIAVVLGCTDSTAFNYNASANTLDNSCCYVSGCIDPIANNYDPIACYDDGSCCYISGCTDLSALNYNPNACYDDGSCAFTNTHTYVPDDNFEQELINLGYDNVLDDYVLTSNISTVTLIDITNMHPIKNLQGIEDFISLEELYCGFSGLSSLDVSNNTSLTKLDIIMTGINSLDLSNNTALNFLWIDNSGFTTLDVSNNTALTNLYVSTSLTSLDVSNNTALTSLGVSCPLTSLDVSNNTALIELTVTNTPLTSLDVSNNTALTKLYCYNNQLTSLDVSNNTALINLRCDDNQLTSLDVRNGNNTNFYNFNATDNPNLTCISVDDPAWSTANWTDIDPQHYFSLTCP